MFSGFMLNTWIAATAVAVIAGVTGFFAVLRGSAFAAHSIRNPGLPTMAISRRIWPHSWKRLGSPLGLHKPSSFCFSTNFSISTRISSRL